MNSSLPPFALPETWRDISTAPRDGTVIIVSADDAPDCQVCWNQFGSNDLAQPGERGIWWGPGGAFTWSGRGGFGPTRWRPIEEPAWFNHAEKDGAEALADCEVNTKTAGAESK